MVRNMLSRAGNHGVNGGGSVSASKLTLICGLIAYTLLSFSYSCGALIFPSKKASLTPSSPTASIKEIKLPDSNKKYFWDLHKVAFSLLPLAPGKRRKTLLAEIVNGKVWTLDQIQGIINVNVPVRAAVVKLKSGGLFVYNPVAPTDECLEYIRSLEQQHGPVKHIVLGSLGLEHKALAGPFSQRFPDAAVWLQPGQWSFPINLPDAFLGFPLGERLQVIPTDGSNPWGQDFDFAVLGPLKFKSVGGYGETAFFHRDTKTLLVTDAVLKVADKPAPILEEDPRALLFHSRESMLDDVQDTEEARLKGWRRMALFGLVFYPSGITVKGPIETLRNVPSLKKEVTLLGEGAVPLSGGLYPWEWKESEESSFKALQKGLLVAPILRKLIMNREPDAVLLWAETVSKWNFRRIIPSHFENDVKSNGREFRAAFSFLEEKYRPAAVAASNRTPTRSSSNNSNSSSSYSSNNSQSSNRNSNKDNNRSTQGSRLIRPEGAAPKEADLFLLNVASDILSKLSIVAPEVTR